MTPARCSASRSYAEFEDAGGQVGAVPAAAWASDPDLGRLGLGGELSYGFAGIEVGASIDSDGRLGRQMRALGTVGVASTPARPLAAAPPPS